MINNITLRKPTYEIPIVNVIMNLPNRHELYCRVDNTYNSGFEFDLATDDLKHLASFGTKEQMDRDWFRSRDTRIMKLKVPQDEESNKERLESSIH